MRFEVSEQNGFYVITDTATLTGELCVYTGAARTPPKYKDEANDNYQWGNYYSALGFSKRLALANPDPS